MERLIERLAVARRALDTLQAVLREPPSALVRDAALQRFEYTFEATWKAAQRFAYVIDGLELSSPKPLIRSAARSSLLTEAQIRAALAMCDDRNGCAHTYNESLADAIFARLPGHAALLAEWLRAMQERIAP